MEQEGPLGRKAALEDLDGFLERVPAGLAALAITGPAGIGKSTVWREGVRRAAAVGYGVLTARPAQAEGSLAFAGLGDLLGSLGEDAFEVLPPVQRHAIDVALLRAQPGRALMDRRAIPVALLSLVESLAATRPLVIAIDDAQWLDEESAASVSFALHRLEHLRVGLIVAVRDEGERTPTVESAVAPERRHEVVLGPLSAATLHWIVRRELGEQLSRPVLARVVTSCGGNPFYALEIARELVRVGMPRSWEPLPVPGELRTLLRRRMGRLPASTKQALLRASCLSQPTTAIVDAVALGPAEEAGIVKVDQTGRVRFTHPLLASAVSDAASAARRRAVHGELAGDVGDPEESARHLAHCVVGPDEEVAARLAEAAARAAGRGAMPTALDLARRAVELTPERTSQAAMRRVISFSEYSVLAGGDPAEARTALESSLAVCSDGNLRAEVLLRLASTAREAYQLADGYARLMSALEETTDKELAARIHMLAVWMADSDAAHGMKHCDAIFELIDETENPAIYSQALMHRAYLQLISGQGADDGAIERGRALEEMAVRQGSRERSPVGVIWRLLEDDLDGAYAAHVGRLEWARQVGERMLEMSMTRFLSAIELWRGNWDEAEHWALTLADMVEESGSSRYRDGALFARGMVDAHRGHLERAEQEGWESLALASQVAGLNAVAPRQLLGFVALSRGDLEAAAEQYWHANAIMESVGQREPAQERFQGDLTETVIGLGDLDRAAELVASLEERARAFPRPWNLVMRARCGGLLSSARGDTEAALAAMQEALTHHDRLPMPFERARTLLAYGQLLRRVKQRRAARAVLTDALDVFVRLGSPLWAERARDELKRLPVRPTRSALTPTEEEIAKLAATGLTARQIAERAFLSRKTVQRNLERVYVKLGVHSRAELGRVMAERS
ncbi:MAG: AAA family ATPase [Acidimicrobiales bacterium]